MLLMTLGLRSLSARTFARFEKARSILAENKVRCSLCTWKTSSLRTVGRALYFRSLQGELGPPESLVGAGIRTEPFNLFQCVHKSFKLLAHFFLVTGID